MKSQLDHLVIAARTLPEGISHITRLLGVAPQPGGAHALMGTHNALLSLGPDCYLEVISIDPQADAPAMKRWFGLDDFKGVPRLVHWVARTDSIDEACPADHRVVHMERNGLRWRFALAPGSHPPLGGTQPALIQWQDGITPSGRLTDHGLRLRRLTLAHADAHRLGGELERLGLSQGETIAIVPTGPPLRAEIFIHGKIVTLA